ncbi:MAG TPA: NADH-quinone oxidoreductase subunit M, partial [Thermoanaerobaculia bacterium]|nr:NADH-quinone oxidoreductase subunit M [Thermoanaerobaculia bacterium]
MDIGILNVVTYVPLVGALWILFFFDDPRNIRWGATFFAAIDFILSLVLWSRFDANASGDAIFQFRWTRDWIPSLGVKYDFGIDGIALLLIILTTFMGIIAVVSSFKAIEHREREYYVLLLLLQTGMIGTFCA